MLDVLCVDLHAGDLAQLGGLDAIHLEAINEQVQSVLVVGRGGRMQHGTALHHCGQVLAEVGAQLVGEMEIGPLPVLQQHPRQLF